MFSTYLVERIELYFFSDQVFNKIVNFRERDSLYIFKAFIMFLPEL